MTESLKSVNLEIDVEVAARIAARVLMRSVMQLFQLDPHRWSTRPCATCKAITEVVGEPFGCDRFRKENPNG